MGSFRKAALALTALLLTGATPSSLYQSQQGVVQEMSEDYPEADYTLTWGPCGELNSMYWPGSHRILLCTEVTEEPRVANFFAAHEMAHAVLMQYIGDGTEESADELATLELLQHGHDADVVNAAMWFMEQDPGHPDGSQHPGNLYRAWNLICMTSGFYNDGNAECRKLYLGTKARLESRLTMDKYDKD